MMNNVTFVTSSINVTTDVWLNSAIEIGMKAYFLFNKICLIVQNMIDTPSYKSTCSGLTQTDIRKIKQQRNYETLVR